MPGEAEPEEQSDLPPHDRRERDTAIRLPVVLQATTGILAGAYAIGSIVTALAWKPISGVTLAVIFLIPVVTAGMVGLNFILRIGPKGPLVPIYLVFLPLAATLFIAAPVTVLAWLLSS